MSLRNVSVDTNMPADVFERIEQLDVEVDYLLVERKYEQALKVVEEIRATISTAISKEVSPTRKARLQDLSDEYRNRFTKMKKDIKEKRRIEPKVKRERPPQPTPPPPAEPSGDPAPFVQLRATPQPPTPPRPVPQPTYTPRPWNEAVATESPKRAEPPLRTETPPSQVSYASSLLTPPPTTTKPAQPQTAPAPRLQNPVSTPFQRQAARPFGVSPTQFGTSTPAYQSSPRTQSPAIVSMPDPTQYAKEEPRQVHLTPTTSSYQPPQPQAVYQRAPEPAYYQAPPSQPVYQQPPPQPVYQQPPPQPLYQPPQPVYQPSMSYAEPAPQSYQPQYSSPRHSPRHGIAPMTVFSPRFSVPLEYERDPEEEHPEPPRRFAPRFKSKPVYTNTAVQTDVVDAAPFQKESIASSPIVPTKEASVPSPAVNSPNPVAVPIPSTTRESVKSVEVKEEKVEPPKVVSPVSRLPQVVLKDDEELLKMIAGDPKNIAVRGDVVKYCDQICKKAQQLATDGFLLKAYVLYEHCHKVTTAAIRVERNEEKIDKLSDLDSDYRREMLNLDRKIKLYGAVMEQTAEADAVAKEIEKPFRPSYSPQPAPQSGSQLDATDAEDATSTMLACFQCGHMVEPVPSHPFPSWLACCCPVKMKCPECGEILDAGDHHGGEEEHEGEEEHGEHEGDGEQEEHEGGEQHDGTNVTAAATQTQTNTQTASASTNASGYSEEAPQLCPQCAVEVIPVSVNSRGDFVAAICPCFNKVTLHCPECDYNLTDMVPADADEEYDEAGNKDDQHEGDGDQEHEDE